MNNHLKKALYLLKAAAVQFKDWFLEMSRDRQAAFVIFVVLLIYTPFFFFGGTKTEETLTENKRVVEVVNVGELSNISTPLSLVGKVDSLSEAVVRTESSGQLTRVYKKLGDKVFAGETIATFENSGERASVLQAEGAYEQAKAARDISNLNNLNTGNSLETAKTNALNSLSSAYITMDDIVRGKTDVAFTNPKTEQAVFNVLVPDQVLIGNIENTRKQIEAMLKNRELQNRTITTDSDLESDLNLVINELNTVKAYLDDLARAYSNSIPNQTFSQAQLDGQKATVGGLRSQVVGSVSAVSGAKQALQGAKTGSQISTGEKSPSQASSDATVKIALGSYQAALARLQKTIVRSPITGTLNSLSIKTGDYAVPSQQVAVVSNNNALEVTTYISNEDVKRVTVGQDVLLNGKIEGVVTRVASAIDPTTRKVEVKVGIKNANEALTNGQSVRVEIKGFTITNVVKTNNDKIKVPLSAVKITPRGASVFFLNEDFTLKTVAVEIGAISGTEVEILSGIVPTDNIIKDARGLKEGNIVEIKSEIENQ